MRVATIARACHEVNRIWCKAHGDDSQPSWDDAPAWQQNSAIAGVIAHIEDPNMTPERSHELWMQAKHEEGWVFGPMKDESRKEHPCMLPYSELPPEQRAKDLLFTRTVAMFLEAETLA